MYHSIILFCISLVYHVLYIVLNSSSCNCINQSNTIIVKDKTTIWFHYIDNRVGAHRFCPNVNNNEYDPEAVLKTVENSPNHQVEQPGQLSTYLKHWSCNDHTMVTVVTRPPNSCNRNAHDGDF